MNTKHVILAAAFCGLTIGQEASAATMQTVFTGTTSADSRDSTGFLIAPSDDPGNAGNLPFEVVVVWNSEPPGLDPALSTIAQDGSSSSFLSRTTGDVVNGVTSVNIRATDGSTEFVNVVNQIQWTRVYDPVSGTSALTFALSGNMLDSGTFNLAVTYANIPGSLPVAYDAAFTVPGAYSVANGSLYRIIGDDPQFYAIYGLENMTMVTVNLDQPAGPPGQDVPLPGALLLLSSGLAALAGYRNLKAT